MKVGDLVKDKIGRWDTPKLLVELDPVAQSLVGVYHDGEIKYIHNYNVEVINESNLDSGAS